MKKRFSIKEDFSTLAMLFIPLGVAINFVPYWLGKELLLS